MKTTLKILMMLVATLSLGVMNVQGLIPNDGDGDGVPDSLDLCPGVNSAPFDRNGDGCLDLYRGARHIEYWGLEDSTLTYVINATGAPNITNGTDLTAIQNAFGAWNAIPNTNMKANYGGTTAQSVADGLDHVNLVTFLDNTYPFSSLVLAVGLSTSFETDTLVAGRVYRKGEIYDTDMLFNPTKTFKTSGLIGTDIQSVATHEAGHMFGISHSTIQSATMFYALPGGYAARSLEEDDELVFQKAYGRSSVLAGSDRIDGTVRDGKTDDPVPGAAVFVLSSSDTAACDYTLPDGSFSFPGLPDGDYTVSIHALDGTLPVGYIQPGNINDMVAATAVIHFPPEFYDLAESNSDDPTAKATITLNGGHPTETIGIITNIDTQAPTVVSATPDDGTNNVAVDGAYVIQFSEAVNVGTITPAFSFRDDVSLTNKGGNIAVIRDDSALPMSRPTVLLCLPSPRNAICP